MIKSDLELIKEVKRYFGSDRRLLKRTLKNYDPSDKEYIRWKVFFNRYAPRKFDISDRMLQEFADFLFSKQYQKIDWDSIGDLSWDVEIILNKEVSTYLDLDKKLAAKCKNNTIRFLNIYISAIIPAFAICTFYKCYKDNVYDFGPLKLTDHEKKLISKIKKDLTEAGYYFVKKEIALKSYKQLRSDINSEGNASIFDCLFNDMDNYTEEYDRFSDEYIIDESGRKTHWKESYDSKKKLKWREDSRWFASGDLEQIVTDANGNITKVYIYPQKDRPRTIGLNIDKIKTKYKERYSIYLP